MQYFITRTQFNPTKCSYTQQPNENSLIVESKFNPISSGPCVHFGTEIESSHCNFWRK